MGQLLIRDLDDSVIQRLERRAQANRTSAEEEARRALTESAAAPLPFDAEAWRAETKAFAEQIGPLDGPTSTELLRADRYREGRR